MFIWGRGGVTIIVDTMYIRRHYRHVGSLILTRRLPLPVDIAGGAVPVLRGYTGGYKVICGVSGESVSSGIRVSVGPTSLHVSACHSSNTNNRRIGAASSTIHVARRPDNIIIAYRGRHDRRNGGTATVGVLHTGLCRLRVRGHVRSRRTIRSNGSSIN